MSLERAIERYRSVRAQSERLCQYLSAEDMAAQSMEDASPVKWHLAHTTWFFETFIVLKRGSRQPFNAHFQHLFNSYYNSVGEPYSRPSRGLLTRPSVDEVFSYRRSIDEALLQGIDESELELLELGLHHEMQHQELLQTDLLHLLWQNPMLPSAMPAGSSESKTACEPAQWHAFPETVMELGADDEGFSYDCERPRHKILITPFKVSSQLVSNADWLEFMKDGGYQNPMLWLSEGWAECQRQQWQSPLYWRRDQDQWCQFGLDGLKLLNPHAPVCHVSYFEAQAFASWAGKRLLREPEHEYLTRELSLSGNFLESQCWRPMPAQSSGVTQLYGDVWEWTQSAFLPYPGFKAENGALGEYNGKFMSGQQVLKGGSCATPMLQMRPSYRNFFYPHQRWQYMGLRLADDC
jgi:ergothioneine biosynthesis protein EgtB